MTQQEIIEYNKRCAEFLGGKYLRDEKLSFEPKGRWHIKQFPDVQQDYNLKFHSDCNWIMEVVESIKEKTKFKIVDECSEQEWYAITGVTRLTITTPKKSVVQAINQFLIWYNENKNS